MSQPFDRGCKVPVPGEPDESLGEFWEDDPWKIMQSHNQSAFEENRAFLNLSGEAFVDVSYLTGLNSDGDGRAVAAADFRNNGRMELIVRQVGGGPLLLYENNLEAGAYLNVSLRGRRNSRLGIGATLTAVAGDLTQTRSLFPSNTYDSQSPALVHFGLGTEETVAELSVLWPDGTRQLFRNIPAGQHIVITEDEPDWTVVVPGRTLAP